MNNLLLVFELARKDLLLFAADRRGVLLSFAVPVVLASVFGAIFHRSDPSEVIRPRVRVVTGDDSPRLAALARELCRAAQLDARPADESSARRWLAEESAGVVVILPASLEGLSPAAKGERPGVLLLHHPNSAVEGRWVEGVLTEVIMRRLAREYLGSTAGERPFDVHLRAEPSGGALAENAFSHSFCGMTLQYLLFWGLDCGLLFLRERRLGIWRRLRSAPVPFAALLAGKAASTAAVALAQVTVTFAVGALFFGVRINGSWAGFVLMALSAALLSAATGLLVASLGGNEARARSVSILAILMLSLLGGLWLPTFLLPGWARSLALALPTTWAARGLEGVVWQGMTLSAAWPCVLALLGFSGLFLSAAYWRLRAGATS